MKRLLFAAWRTLAGLSRPTRARNERLLRARGEDPATFRIRDATPDDIPALARLHVETWNATYAPLLTKGPGYELRERQWREGFARGDPDWFCLLVERPDGKPVGFAKGNRSDNPEFAGELNKIYLLRDYQRVGLGGRLIAELARRFLDRGIESMWLYGDPRNPSRSAWIALGAVETDDDPGTGSYGWRDIRPLAARAVTFDGARASPGGG